MARPKYRKSDVLATEKLSASFWKLLSTNPYSKLSISEICKDAGLIKNTFYYHYENLDDMAMSLIHASLDERFAALILCSAFNDTTTIPEDYIYRNEQFQHLCLVAGKNSHPLLISTLKESILKVWFSVLKKDESEIPKDLYIASVFAINGILSLLALNNTENDFSFITAAELIQQDFVKALLKSIVELANK